MWTSVLHVISVTAVQLAIIQMDLTHAPVTVATQEMDEPAMVNKLLDQMRRFHKRKGTRILAFLNFFAFQSYPF